MGALTASQRLAAHQSGRANMKGRHLIPFSYRTATGRGFVTLQDEEDEHLYHTMGWARELWMESLGMKAVIPPPEEVKDVKTAIGAAPAQNARSDMM